MADVCLSRVFDFDQWLKFQRFRIPRLGNKALDVSHHTLMGKDFYSCHMGFVWLMENLFYQPLSYFLTIVVDQEDFNSIRHLILNGQEDELLVHIIAKDCQAWAIRNTLHTTYAFVVINCGCAGGCWLADGSLRTRETTRVAGKTIETVGLNERFHLHTLFGRQIGLLQDSDRMLLRVNILARDIEILIIIII